MNIVDVMVEFVEDRWTALKEFWEKYGQDLVKMTKGFWNGIFTAIEFVLDKIKIAWEFVMNNLVEVITFIVDVIKEEFDRMWINMEGILKIAEDTFTLTFETIASVVGLIFDNLLVVIGAFIDLFTGDWDGMIDTLSEGFSGFGDGLVAIFANIVTGIKGLFQDVVGWVISKLNWMIKQANRLPGVNLSYVY